MSQAKVDQKKYDKTHRKSLVRKKKFEEVLSICCVSVIGIAIAAWIGYSIYDNAKEAAEANITYDYYDISTTAIQDYISTLSE